jgi:DNA polymerase III alpha subunit
MKNEFVFEGAVKWPPTLKTTANGNPLLPLTLEQDKASISMVLFQEVATALAAVVQQGSVVMVRGYQNQRKDSSSGYYHNSAVGNSYSLDSGQTWVSEQSLKQQYQTQQGQQQNPQVAHLQQCQSQFQQQPAQSHQPQQQQPTQAQPPIQTIQPQQPAPKQAATQVQQTREQFLNTNQYTGNQPPSAEAVKAQADLYAPPSTQQPQPHIVSNDQQSSAQAQPPAQSSDDFGSDSIPF